jgi:hypothetical protein
MHISVSDSQMINLYMNDSDRPVTDEFRAVLARHGMDLEAFCLLRSAAIGVCKGRDDAHDCRPPSALMGGLGWIIKNIHHQPETLKLFQLFWWVIVWRKPMSDLVAKRKNICGWGADSQGSEFTFYVVGEYPENKEYRLLENGQVFEGDSFDPVEVTDPSVMAMVKGLAEADRQIDAARRARAKQLAKQLHGGDPRAEDMFLWHMEFRNGDVAPTPLTRNGVNFYQVGRNASHSFFLGMKNGKCFHRSFTFWLEEDMYGQLVLDEDGAPKEVEEEHIRQVHSWRGLYCGHF